MSLQNTPSLIEFTTIGPVEINWIVGYPDILNINIFDIDVVCKTDVAGTIYYVVLSFDENAPTIDQIKLGTDNNDNPLPTDRFGNFQISQNTKQFLSIANLQKDNVYNVYFVASSSTDTDGEIKFLTVTMNAQVRTLQSQIISKLKYSTDNKTNWPRLSKVPKPNNYRELLISRKPISYWRLGDRDIFAKDEARYVDGQFKFAQFDGLNYESQTINKTISQNIAPIQVNDSSFSSKFQWDEEPIYKTRKGDYVEIPHKSRFTGMSTLLLDFFFKMDLPKGKNGSLLSKTDATTIISPIYRNYQSVTVIRDYDVVPVNYTANTPFVLECDFKLGWDGNDDKYLIAFATSEEIDFPNWNYGISGQRLMSYDGVFDTSAGEVTNNNKYHLKLIYDGTNLQVYLNDILKNTRAVNVPLSTQIRIGNFHNEENTNANSDWFRGEIWNFKLTFDPVIMPAYHIELDNGKLKGIVSDGSSTVTALSSNVISDENWHHVMALFKDRILKLYLDDVLVGTSPALGSDYIYPLNTSTIQIARSPNEAFWPFFNGWIDEVAIFDWDWYS